MYSSSLNNLLLNPILQEVVDIIHYRRSKPLQNRKPGLIFFTLLLLISFASVNAVLFTPALPDIATYFSVSSSTAQHTMTWFLVGYAVGQLIYGPLANRFGRKPALYAGIILQIVSSLICVLSAELHHYAILVLGRLLLALGSGVGLQMTFTLVSECYTPEIASRKISYLMLAFAITPGLAIALGGYLNTHFGWVSCFYASAAYGVLLLLLVRLFPHYQQSLNYNALKFQHLLHTYRIQFKNPQLVRHALLMGCSASFVYVFSALGPFIAIDFFALSSKAYGYANILPPIGLALGSLLSAKLMNDYQLNVIMRVGIVICCLGTLLMAITLLSQTAVLIFLFTSMVIIYFGIAFVMGNASAIAMRDATDKANGSAIMSFINMGLTTLVVLSVGWAAVAPLLLPVIFIMLCSAMLFIYRSIEPVEKTPSNVTL